MNKKKSEKFRKIMLKPRNQQLIKQNKVEIRNFLKKTNLCIKKLRPVHPTPFSYELTFGTFDGPEALTNFWQC